MELYRRQCLVSAMLLSLCLAPCNSTQVSHDGRAIVIDGKRRLLISGSIHYPRSTPQMWPDLIQKAKDGGLDAIETYVFWNVHEPRPREYNFEGNLDLVRFIKEIQNAGLYAVLRIGPYVCAEWNYGGIPAWLRQIPGMEFRTNNQPFKDEMQRFTTLIVNMLKQENLLAPQGGPIIITQIENEYGNIQGPFGEAGNEYIQWCANLAESFDVGVPWIMCQQSNAPQPMINTCNGFYCNEFNPNSKSSPKMWTENWTGWFKAWGKPDPHRLAEDVAYSVARFFQSNGTFQNYYMYHGGTNFGRTTGGPYITTTYDYDAPLDEYGNIRQPKYGHLKQLHEALKSMEQALLYGQVKWTDEGNGLSVTNFSGEGITPGCFLTNKNTTGDAYFTIGNKQYHVPAWSISVLPDCVTQVYNTAKVSVQSSQMVKKRAENQPAKLTWSWRPESLRQPLRGLGGSFTANRLQEQIVTTADASDYLWYMTSVDNGREGNMTLHVNTTGHILYAFVNGKLVGAEYSPNGPFNFVFERRVFLKQGANIISLLSATVGLKNYGARYEQMPAGIVGGPVQLIAGNATLDLSQNTWSYKIGLDGENKKIGLGAPGVNWRSGALATNRPFTWYKTTFQAPLGSDAVVLDLLGLGKGEAWVNGHSIGRYWPTYIASENGGCKNVCDYRGQFQPKSCQSGCGHPSQRWYHVPRSFMKEGEPNTLVLFEEAGGDPAQVSFQTVTVGKVRGSAEENSSLTLSCQARGRTIKEVEFASFGDPQGATCDSEGLVDAVKAACVGKESCSLQAVDSVLGTSSSTCGGARERERRLVVQATC